jgi:hypothetical protein
VSFVALEAESLAPIEEPEDNNQVTAPSPNPRYSDEQFRSLLVSLRIIIALLD